jgi:hypothetical protein
MWLVFDGRKNLPFKKDKKEKGQFNWVNYYRAKKDKSNSPCNAYNE